jgi:hypothetical protein
MNPASAETTRPWPRLLEGYRRTASFCVPAQRAVSPLRRRWCLDSSRDARGSEPALTTAPGRSRLPCPGVFAEGLGIAAVQASRATPPGSARPVSAGVLGTAGGPCAPHVLLLPCRACRSSPTPYPHCRLSSSSSSPRRLPSYMSPAAHVHDILCLLTALPHLPRLTMSPLVSLAVYRLYSVRISLNLI